MSPQNHQRSACLGDESRQGHFLTLSQREYLSDSLQTELRPECRLRVEIMLRADAGQSQTQICKALRCSREAVRYWAGMLRAGEIHRWQDQPRGRPKSVNQQYLVRLKELATQSPRDYGYSFQHWTSQWLRKHLTEELGIEVSDSSVLKLLKQLGLSRRKSAARAISSSPFSE